MVGAVGMMVGVLSVVSGVLLQPIVPLRWLAGGASASPSNGLCICASPLLAASSKPAPPPPSLSPPCSTLHFYNLKSTLSVPQQMVVAEIDDPFVPLPDDLLVRQLEAGCSWKQDAASLALGWHLVEPP